MTEDEKTTTEEMLEFLDANVDTFTFLSRCFTRS